MAKKLQDPILEPVRQYLEKRAAEDPDFAEKYANPKKSLEECCRYIYGEAKKRAAGSTCVYVPPEEVFGWAVHYYDEADIKVFEPGFSGRAEAKPVEVFLKEKRIGQCRGNHNQDSPRHDEILALAQRSIRKFVNAVPVVAARNA